MSVSKTLKIKHSREICCELLRFISEYLQIIQLIIIRVIVWINVVVIGHG